MIVSLRQGTISQREAQRNLMLARPDGTTVKLLYATPNQWYMRHCEIGEVEFWRVNKRNLCITTNILEVSKAKFCHAVTPDSRDATERVVEMFRNGSDIYDIVNFYEL